MPKLDLDAIPQTNATGYPQEFAGEVQRRFYKRLGPVYREIMGTHYPVMTAVQVSGLMEDAARV